ncbi:MAG: RraA family protein [Nitrospiraceae bacterium]|jgi:regulator of RNase E activity RraA
MTDDLLNEDDLAALRALDTPTVCNAIEVLAPERRGYGYTVEPLICSYPELPPMVGYARTATIRAMHPPKAAPEEVQATRIGYYEYVEAGPRPSIIVIQDLDPVPGYGSFWGEVQSNVHKGLGALGTITNGCVRDIPDCAEGFQFMSASIKPSHAAVHVVAYGLEVTVAGMDVSSGDLIHADRHGAVVVPLAIARDIPKTAETIARKEAVVIGAARKPGFSVADLREAFKKQADIH